MFQETLKLWEGTPPTDNGLSGEETVENTRVRNISIPEMTIFRPDESKNKRLALIISPGGGYAKVSLEHEGMLFGRWLQQEGYTGVVLKYRLPNKHKEVPLDDIGQAIRYVRNHAPEWGIDKIGVSGFSAGGQMAASATLFPSAPDLKPDFSILFYPVITMGEYTHYWTKLNLLGDNPTQDEIERYSLEKQVTPDTPPCLILFSHDDRIVSSLNGTMYYEALRKNDVLANLHIFPSGGHGWGLLEDFKYHKDVISLLRSWLHDMTEQ